MQRYLIRRVIALVPLVIGVTLISFLLMHFAPGDPTAIYIDPTVGDTAEMREIVRERLGLDQPLPVQYARWFGRAIQGDLGFSFVSHRPVIQEIVHRIPNTLMLVGAAVLMALFLGLTVGVYSALNQYRTSDYIVTVLAFIGVSIPNFWLGLMMILLFSGTLGWLPSVGMRDIMAPPGTVNAVVDTLRHMVMPATVLSVFHMASWARYQRSAMLEVIRQDYVRTARAKGLSERVVIYRHALRNAAIPVITLLGMSVATIMSGSFIVEQVFAWPGMGRLGVNAIFSRDYPVVMGVTLMSSILVLAGNFTADIMYAVVDPRIRYD